jgi:hypothetical protein
MLVRAFVLGIAVSAATFDIVRAQGTPSAGAPSAKEMRFESVSTGGNCRGCEWIAADGEITRDSHRRFLDLFGSGDFVPTVYLNSPGGDLVGAILLGEAIRKLGADTSVGQTLPDDSGWHKTGAGQCLSACAFAFLGGKERFINPGSEIGLHQFYDADALRKPTEKLFTALDASLDQLLTGLVLDYVVRMGTDAQLVVVASKTPPTDMHILSEAEARELRVTWSPDDFGPWQIEPYGEGLVAFSRSQDKKKTLTMFCDSQRTSYVLYAVAGEPSVITEEALHSTPNVDVMGANIPTRTVGFEVRNGTTRLRFPLPEDFKLPTTDSTAISNWTDGPHFGWWHIEVNAKGMQRAGALAFRNCV